jgi:hypothetical protein
VIFAGRALGASLLVLAMFDLTDIWHGVIDLGKL